MNKKAQRLQKIVRILLIFASVTRVVAAGCFLYAGSLTVKNYGPGTWQKLKQAIKSIGENDLNDPLALAMKEREAAKAGKSSSSKKSDKEDWESASLRRDDPYKYIAGGKAAEKTKSDKSDGSDQSDQPAASDQSDAAAALAAAAGAGGEKKGLWDKGSLGQGSIEGGLGFGGQGSGGAGSSGGGPGAGGEMAQKLQDQLKGAEQARGAGGLAAGKGTSARSTRQGIKAGSLKARAAASAKGGLRGAAKTARGAGRAGGFQASAGGMGASFGQGVTGQTLNIPDGVGGSSGAGALDGDLSNPMLNQNLDDMELEVLGGGTMDDLPSPDEEKKFLAINIILAATALTGVVLMATAEAAKDSEFGGIAWWIAYGLAAVALIAALIMVFELKNSSHETTRAMAEGQLMPVIGAMIGYALLAAAYLCSGTASSVLSKLGGVGDTATQLIGMFDGDDQTNTDQTNSNQNDQNNQS